MSHLEDLIFQYYDWRGYIVRRNIKVGRLGHGGWEGELDIVAYHPQKKGAVIHLEPSIDALSWQKREERFSEKFARGREYIFTDVFPWLKPDTPLEQVAVLVSAGRSRTHVGGGEIVTIDEIARQIKDDVAQRGRMASAAIPEQYDLLRTVQLVLGGYYRVL